MATAFQKYGNLKNLNVLLHSGDRMSQPEFHRLYEQMPQAYKAELIGGIVFEPSPVSPLHSEPHGQLITLFGNYTAATRGLRFAGNTTVKLSGKDEVEPDALLWLPQEKGGQSHIGKDKYIVGAPELVAEVAYSSRNIDLHLKKERYRRGGVIEYLVLCMEPERLHWFDFKNKRTIRPDRQDILRSTVFPGLWINGPALLALDLETALETLNQGLKSSEHAEFAAALRKR